MKNLKSMLVLVLFAAFSVSVGAKNIDSLTHPLTVTNGEQLTMKKGFNDDVYSGCININGQTYCW